MGFTIRVTLVCDGCDLLDQKGSFQSDEGPGPCPRCSALLREKLAEDAGYYFSDERPDYGEAPTLTSVNPVVDLGDGVLRTARSAEAFAQSKARPGWTAKLEVAGSTTTKARADEKRHAAYEKDKARGIDKGFKSVFTEACDGVQAAASKKALKDNQNPDAAAYAATKSLPSVAEAAAGAAFKPKEAPPPAV